MFRKLNGIYREKVRQKYQAFSFAPNVGVQSQTFSEYPQLLWVTDL